ncbi:unnamed protein product, partial [Rotaria sp. Silwood1]
MSINKISSSSDTLNSSKTKQLPKYETYKHNVIKKKSSTSLN